MFKTKSENVIFKRSLKFQPVPSGLDRVKYAKITHLAISIGRRRKSAIAREDLRHIQARDFWVRTADVARSRAAEPTDVGVLI